MCPSMWAHWHHLANTIEIMHIGTTWQIRLNLWFLVPTQVHNTNGNLIDAAVSAQLMAESPYTFNGRPFILKLPLIMGELDPIKFVIPWASPSPQSKLHHDRFSCFRILPMGESGPVHVTHDFLGPSEPTTQMAYRSVQPFLQGSVV